MSLVAAPRLILSVPRLGRRALLNLIKALVKVKQHQRRLSGGQIVQIAAHYRNYLTAHEKKGMVKDLAAKMAGGDKVAHKSLASAKAMAKASAKETGKAVHVHYDEASKKYVTSHEPPAGAAPAGKHHLTAHATGKVTMKHAELGEVEANPLLMGKQLHQVGAKHVEHLASLTAAHSGLNAEQTKALKEKAHEAHKAAIAQALEQGEKVSAAALKAHPEFQEKADQALKAKTEAKAKAAAAKLEGMSEAAKAKLEAKKQAKHQAAAKAAQAHEEAAKKYGRNSDEAASAGTELKKHGVLLHPQKDGTTHYRIGGETVHAAAARTDADKPAEAAPTDGVIDPAIHPSKPVVPNGKAGKNASSYKNTFVGDILTKTTPWAGKEQYELTEIGDHGLLRGYNLTTGQKEVITIGSMGGTVQHTGYSLASAKKPGGQPGNKNAYKGGPKEEPGAPAHGKVLPGDKEPTHATPAIVAHAQTLGDGPAAKAYQQALEKADDYESRVQKFKTGSKQWSAMGLSGSQYPSFWATKKEALDWIKLNTEMGLAKLKEQAEAEAAEAKTAGEPQGKAGQDATPENTQAGDVVKSKHYDGDCVVLGVSKKTYDGIKNDTVFDVLTPTGHVDTLLGSGLVHTDKQDPGAIALYKNDQGAPVPSGKTGAVTKDNFAVGDWIEYGGKSRTQIVGKDPQGNPIGFWGGESHNVPLSGATFYQTKEAKQAALVGQKATNPKQIDTGMFLHNPLLNQTFKVYDSSSTHASLEAPDGTKHAEVSKYALMGMTFADEATFNASGKKPGGQPGNQNAYKGGPKTEEGAAALKQAHEEVQAALSKAADAQAKWAAAMGSDSGKTDQEVVALDDHMKAAKATLKDAQAKYATHTLSPEQMKALNAWHQNAQKFGDTDAQIHVTNDPGQASAGSAAILSWTTAKGEKQYTRLNPDGSMNLGVGENGLALVSSQSDGFFHSSLAGHYSSSAGDVLKAGLKPIVLKNGAAVMVMPQNKAGGPGTIGGAGSMPGSLHIQGVSHATSPDMDDTKYAKTTLSGAPYHHSYSQAKLDQDLPFTVDANHGTAQAYMDPALSQAGATGEQALMWEYLVRGHGHAPAVKPLAAGMAEDGSLVIKHWKQPYKKGDKPMMTVITPAGTKTGTVPPLEGIKAFHGSFTKDGQGASGAAAPEGAIAQGEGTYIADPSIKATYAGELGTVAHGTGPSGNGVELKFASKPDADTLAQVKKFYKWSGANQCWWAKNPGPNAMKLAHEVMGTGKKDAGKAGASSAAPTPHPTGNKMSELYAAHTKANQKWGDAKYLHGSKAEQKQPEAKAAYEAALAAIDAHAPEHVAAHLNAAQLATVAQYPGASVLAHAKKHTDLPILEHPVGGSDTKVTGSYINPDGSLSGSWVSEPSAGIYHPGAYDKWDHVKASSSAVQAAASGKKPGGQPGNQNAYKGGPKDEPGSSKAGQPASLENIAPGDTLDMHYDFKDPGKVTHQLTVVEHKPDTKEVVVQHASGNTVALPASMFDPADSAFHMNGPIMHSGKEPGGQPGNQNAYKGGPKDEPTAPQAEPKHGDQATPENVKVGDQLKNAFGKVWYTVTAKDDQGITVKDNDNNGPDFKGQEFKVSNADMMAALEHYKPETQAAAPQAEPKHGDPATMGNVKVGDQLGTLNNSNLYNVTGKDEKGITIEHVEGGYTGKVAWNDLGDMFHHKPEPAPGASSSTDAGDTSSGKEPGGQPGNQNAAKGVRATPDNTSPGDVLEAMTSGKQLTVVGKAENGHHILYNAAENMFVEVASLKHYTHTGKANFSHTDKVAGYQTPVSSGKTGKVTHQNVSAGDFVTDKEGATHKVIDVEPHGSGVILTLMNSQTGKLDYEGVNVGLNSDLQHFAGNLTEEATGKKPGGQPGNQNAYKGGPQDEPGAAPGVPQEVIDGLKAKYNGIHGTDHLMQVKAAPDGSYTLVFKDISTGPPHSNAMHYAAYDAKHQYVGPSSPGQLSKIQAAATHDVTMQVTGHATSPELPSPNKPHPDAPTKPNGKAGKAGTKANVKPGDLVYDTSYYNGPDNPLKHYEVTEVSSSGLVYGKNLLTGQTAIMGSAKHVAHLGHTTDMGAKVSKPKASADGASKAGKAVTVKNSQVGDVVTHTNYGPVKLVGFAGNYTGKNAWKVELPSGVTKVVYQKSLKHGTPEEVAAAAAAAPATPKQSAKEKAIAAAQPTGPAAASVTSSMKSGDGVPESHQHLLSSTEAERSAKYQWQGSATNHGASKSVGHAVCSKLHHKLTSKQSAALSSYRGSGYVSMNSTLREGTKPTKWTSESIAALDQAMGQADGIPHDMTFKRGKGPWVRQMLEKNVGKVFVEDGFTSVSNSEQTAEGFSKYGGVMINVRVPKGTPGLYMDQVFGNNWEYELMLPRGCAYIVHSVKPVSGEKYSHVADIELIHPGQVGENPEQYKAWGIAPPEPPKPWTGKEFKSADEAKAWAVNNTANPINGSIQPEHQKAADAFLNGMVHDVNGYYQQGQKGEAVKNNPALKEKVMEVTAGLSSAIASAPGTDQDITLKKMMASNYMSGQYTSNVGEAITDPGFPVLSHTPTTALSAQKSGQQPIEVTYHIPKGAKVAYLGDHPTTKEPMFALPKDSAFHVKESKKEAGLHKVTLELK